MTAVLVLCTANVCRSVMAQVMLTARRAERGAPGLVSSAGLLGGGRPPPPAVITVMAARGVDISEHRSRAVTVADLAAADLIVGLAREHVRHAAVLLPSCWPRAFTLRELLRRGGQAGPRAPGEPMGGWLAAVAAGRSRRDLLGSGTGDDVPDPYGGPLADYQATARQLDELTRDLAALCWPVPEARRPLG
jgi:protein-tyrosine phosphatase